METSAKEAANVDRAFLKMVQETQLARAQRIKDRIHSDHQFQQSDQQPRKVYTDNRLLIGFSDGNGGNGGGCCS